MKAFNRKKHWENIYRTRELKDVSWFQPTPETSLSYFEAFEVPTTARIIDVGGGDSLLADHLLERGYSDITVLDISAEAINRARERLGHQANRVKWIVADAANFTPSDTYDFWHDRAAFHFLTDPGDIAGYLDSVRQGLNPDGILVIGTFSVNGPEKCSGIRVMQYSGQSMARLLEPDFEKIRCETLDHRTPSGSMQNFVFCSFRRKAHRNSQ
ncbi:class I SAM-dependent methyltransferase [Robiginitalea biformata]|uniref:Methyltransferase domain-containing protein n=1 Tax=Robiginitalea biformata (strain ATCC BAA-864 / DSM 15991 / KCTC 12146 / HTCC2501) TaxID=313596 RepID=A4CN03_ROBBH|nr:class I SAM-dependent methyltransferase [Robiginitalea biformata]EAR15045.1 hypothetical protein RB2501_11982 [Robiginitalea biformata HTCC2501]